MNLPIYAIGDESGQPVSRQLSATHAAYQAALDAWLATEYWPLREHIQAELIDICPFWRAHLMPFAVPLAEVNVASEWLRSQLLIGGQPVLSAERLTERYIEVARGGPPWNVAAWVLSEVQAGHIDALLAEPPPKSCSITKSAPGVMTFTLYFGQRIALTTDLGGSQ